MKAALLGDVDHSRVARSNAWLLSKMGAEVRFVGPRTLMPTRTALLPGTVYYDLESRIVNADVVMCLRPQRDRLSDGLSGSLKEYPQFYQLNRSNIRLAKPGCIVLHPRPIHRGIEIDDAIADSPRYCISLQVENGIFVRMVSLSWVFSGDSEGKAS